MQDLEKIISRDFFPDLERLKVQSEYLEALEKNDHTQLRALHNKYSVLLQRDAVVTPARSLSGFESSGDADPEDINRSGHSKATHNPPKSGKHLNFQFIHLYF